MKSNIKFAGLIVTFIGQVLLAEALRAATEEPAGAVGTVPEIAQQDQIWTKTWRFIQKDLQNNISSNEDTPIVARLSEKFDVDFLLTNLFIRYSQNYHLWQLNSSRVLYRYPHYNLAAIDQDLDTLVDAGLLIKDSQEETYMPSDLGKQIVIEYRKLRTEQVIGLPRSTKELFNTVSKTLWKVVDNALQMEDSWPNDSIKLRRQSWFDANIMLDPVTLSRELYLDYTAFNNDNAHYRFDRLGKDSPGANLTALEKELLASMRNGRERTFSYCAKHVVWRQTDESCRTAFTGLSRMGLIDNNGSDTYRQSKNGSELFDKAQALTNSRFYSPWAILTMKEYMQYKNAVELISIELKP